MSVVTLQPSGRTVEVPDGTSLLDAAIAAGATSVECCGKHTLCGLCKVAVLEGEGNLGYPDAREAEFRSRRKFLPFQRLGCLTSVHGDVEVELER